MGTWRLKAIKVFTTAFLFPKVDEYELGKLDSIFLPVFAAFSAGMVLESSTACPVFRSAAFKMRAREVASELSAQFYAGTRKWPLRGLAPTNNQPWVCP